MTRVLVFDGDHGPKRFELCRIAVLSAGNGKGERTRDVIRREARLLDALDTVSAPRPDTDVAAPNSRVLLSEGGTVALAQEDFALLEQYLDTTPWLPMAARAAVDAQDWLSAAAKVEGTPTP